jgi:hypothetical protein
MVERPGRRMVARLRPAPGLSSVQSIALILKYLKANSVFTPEEVQILIADSTRFGRSFKRAAPSTISVHSHRKTHHRGCCASETNVLPLSSRLCETRSTASREEGPSSRRNAPCSSRKKRSPALPPGPSLGACQMHEHPTTLSGASSRPLTLSAFVKTAMPMSRNAQ